MAEEPAHAKRARPDLALRAQVQRERSYTVVQCTLRSLCRSARVFDGLQHFVLVSDRMVREAYHIANVDAIRRIEQGIPPRIPPAVLYVVPPGDEER